MPAQGATLYADAATLRPLVVNGLWTYRGVETTVGASAPTVVYSNSVSQQAGTGGAVIETATNVDNGGAAQQGVSTRAGEVHTTSRMNFGNGTSQLVDQLELRSPVRVDDQYTLLDMHQPDGGVDIDGDGKNDALDFAMYSRVVGDELVDLMSYPQAKALRVRTVVMARFRLSRTGAYTDTSSGTLDNWYAQGIGVVKRSSDIPGAVAGSRVLTSETLVNWDGVTQGVGFLDAKPAVTAAGDRLRYVADAVSFDTHALMMSFAFQGVTLSQIDARGQLTSSRAHTGISASRARLFRVGDAARVVAMTDSGLQMYSFDAAGDSTAAGSVQLKAGGVAASGSNQEFVGASSGNILWVVWAEPSPDPLSHAATLQTQPFNSAGQPLTAPVVLASVTYSTLVSNLQADGRSGRVVISWDEVAQAGGWGSRYALIDGVGATTVTIHTLIQPGGTMFGPRAVVSSTGSAMLWTYPFNGGASEVNGINFDTAGEPRRSNNLAIETEHLTLPWLSNVGGGLQVSGGTKVDVSVGSQVKLWPEDSVATATTIVTELTPAAGPLATQNQARLLARGVFTQNTTQVSLPGNVLMMADDGSGISVTSVWRRR